MGAVFGPAGNSQSFTGKSNIDVPPYLVKMGLDAYEYQCGRGVKISEASATAFGEAAKAAGIALSIHAPYFISLSGADPEKRANSVNYVLQTAAAARAMGATRMVVHSGSVGTFTREEATALAAETLRLCLSALDERGWGDIAICPETMGKTGQLGTLDEVLTLCELDERLIPCVDFGHLNARTFGGLREVSDYAAVLDQIEARLGYAQLKQLHVHFSKIEFTIPGGEKRHLTFADDAFGPEFPPLADLIWERDLSPTIICESAGTQAEDAATMKAVYEEGRV